MGPVSPCESNQNHPSALNYPAHVDAFLNKEISLGGILGPFSRPPFSWVHVAPLMTRPKSDGESRRVITDLTFPREVSINDYILKNSVYGEERPHSLPTVESLVEILVEFGPEAHLATIDISRAYKNFKTDPGDWPLLCIKWNGKWLCDITMPFGARGSSMHMQRIARAIVRILESKGVTCKMYLDDLVIIARNHEECVKAFQIARELFQELGLPEAEEKTQYPSSAARWLGINVDAANMMLSIPPEKVAAILAEVEKYLARRRISKKQLQSLVGSLIHLAKCVQPARLFVGRLLEGLKGLRKPWTSITSRMKEDLRWFAEFCADWNGRSLIPSPSPTRIISLDACPTGIGGEDGVHAYALQVAPMDDPVTNICHLEGGNVPVALHTFVSARDRGGHILFLLDNEAAVHVLNSGRGDDPVLLDIARACWLVQAKFDLKITYQHIAGVNNAVADRLSRAHLSDKDLANALGVIDEHDLALIEPCTYVFNILDPPIPCRSGRPLASPESSGAAESFQSGSYMEAARHSGKDIYRFCEVRQVRAQDADDRHDPRLHRVPRAVPALPRHDSELCLARSPVPSPHRRPRRPRYASQGRQGDRGAQEKQVLRPKKEARRPRTDARRHPRHAQHVRRRTPRPRRNTASLPRRAQAVGAGPPVGGKVQGYPSHDKGRRNHLRGSHDDPHHRSQEHAAGWGGEDSPHLAHPDFPPLPGSGGGVGNRHGADGGAYRSFADVLRSQPSTNIAPQRHVGRGTGAPRHPT